MWIKSFAKHTILILAQKKNTLLIKNFKFQMERTNGFTSHLISTLTLDILKDKQTLMVWLLTSKDYIRRCRKTFSLRWK